MRRTRLLWFIFVFVLSVVLVWLAVLPILISNENRRQAEDRARLQGRWLGGGAELTVVGDEMRIAHSGTDWLVQSGVDWPVSGVGLRFRFDFGGSPSRLWILDTSEPVRWRPAIYELQGDHLRIVIGEAGSDFPTIGQSGALTLDLGRVYP